MKRVVLLSLICIVLLVSAIGVAGCNPSGSTETTKPEGSTETTTPTESQEVFELSLATIHPLQSPFNETNLLWIDWMEKESNGRVKITLYPAEQAAKGTECYDSARTGVIDIGCQLVAFNPGRWPITEVTMLPFIFNYPGCISGSMTSTELFNRHPEIQAEHSEVKVLGIHTNSPNHIHTVNKPVHTMEDLNGMVLDIAGTWGAAAMQALGGTPETTSPAERYDALAKGVLDGVASTEWGGHISWGNIDICNYSTECSLNLFSMMHVMNLDTWNKLPADLQALFEGENATNYLMLMGYMFDLHDIACREEVEAIYKSRGNEGIYVLPADEKARWVEATVPLREQWVETAAATIGEEKAREILDDCLQLAEQYSGYPDEVCPQCANLLAEWSALGE